MILWQPVEQKKRGRPSKKELVAEERRLAPETYRSIFGIILIIFGFIFLLSIFGAAGTVGKFLDDLLRLVFGFAALTIPLLCFGVGVSVLFPNRFPLKPLTLFGVILFLLAFSALLHLVFVPEDIFFKVARNGSGGGMVGAGIAYIFVYVFDFWASLIILTGSLIISVLLSGNVSLFALREKGKSFLIKLGFISGEETISTGEKIKKPGFLTRLLRRRKKKEEHEPKKKIALDSKWKFPPLELLSNQVSEATSGNIKKNSEIIKQTLENFNIEVNMGDVNVGPTVTQYTLKPTTGVKLNQITARNNDLSLALAAHPIRIEAPIPGKSAVGIEIPNKVPAIVRLRPIIESKTFKKFENKTSLSIALGQDVSGSPQTVRLDTMPHLLIAGATGSGKSICLNSIITTFIYHNTPDELKIILVDPKRVEFTEYNGVPHLLTPVITKPEETISALRWLVAEMDRRYNLFQEKSKRNIDAYNKSASEEEKIPFIVLCIDELADLMAVAAREVEASIVRLAQLARATGIHLVVATQRPSVDVITGLIKANITSRIAFAVASGVDARTILDYSGAERLLGNGDMLFVSNEVGKPRRIQGVFISDSEIRKVTKFLKKQAGEVEYDETVTSFRPETGTGLKGGGVEDDLFDDACEVVLNAGKASASLLQRRLRVGYARAARLLDILEEKGIVGQQEGSKPREVLIDPATYDRLKEGKEHPVSVREEGRRDPASSRWTSGLRGAEKREESGEKDKEQKGDKNDYDEDLGEI